MAPARSGARPSAPLGDLQGAESTAQQPHRTGGGGLAAGHVTPSNHHPVAHVRSCRRAPADPSPLHRHRRGAEAVLRARARGRGGGWGGGRMGCGPLLTRARTQRAWGCLTTWVQLQTAVSHTPSPTGVLDIPICNGAVIDFTKSYDPYVGLLIYAGNVSALIHYTPLGFNPTKDAPCVRAQQPPRPSALSSAHSYLGKGVNENTTTINFYCGPCGSPASCSCTFDGGNSSGLVSSAYGDTTIAGLDSPVGRLTTLSFTNITFQNGRLVGGAGAGLYVLSSPARPMSVVTQSCVFRGNFAGQAAAVDVIASVSLSAFDTVFERNSGAGSVLFSGNAVVITGAVATLERCLFKDNTAPGGVRLSAATTAGLSVVCGADAAPCSRSQAGGALYLGPFDNESFSNYIPQAPANVFLPGLATVLNSRFDGNAAAVRAEPWLLRGAHHHQPPSCPHLAGPATSERRLRVREHALRVVYVRIRWQHLGGRKGKVRVRHLPRARRRLVQLGVARHRRGVRPDEPAMPLAPGVRRCVQPVGLRKDGERVRHRQSSLLGQP